MQRERAAQTAVVVIGAGVVGCAIAYELTQLGFSPIVLERGPRIAEGITSRNSGVIHAALYYPPASLKAQACLRGKALLYEWCESHRVPFRRIGKWIVGAKSEALDLEQIYLNATQSGATGLHRQPEWRLDEMIPGVKAEIGFYSSETGIVDPYEYSRSLLLAAEEQGAQLITHAQVRGVTTLSSGSYLLDTTRGEIEAEIVVNAAGLFADDIARMAGIDKYRVYPWRGDYFNIKLPKPISHLIYPVKKKGAPGLGVHLTATLDGRFKLGPDVECIDSKEDFSPPRSLEQKQRAFFEAAGRYLEGIRYEDLSYDSCGIRPKLRSPSAIADGDFIVSKDLPGWINLVGIESPGLTSSRDLAQRVVALV